MPRRTLHVPSDVTEREKFGYFGRQRRWYVAANYLAFVVLMISMSRFSVALPAVSPLLLVSTFMLIGGTLGLYTSTRRRRQDRIDHEVRVATWIPAHAPSVDVYLPTCGESLELLRNTYEHVAALRYPGSLRVYVLDDGGRSAVERAAARYGFDYLSRPPGQRGVLKKAGNLNFAFPRTSGEVILILDADFAPRADLLRELMPYLDDPRVGIVQSPQYFDTRGPMGWLQRGAGATQEYFYRWVQPSRDALDASVCVGTCAVYRRAALEDCGWFVPIAHSEDVYTGLQVMKAGYQVRYIPVNLAKGLCPDTLGAFIGQQYRWCTGSLSLMVNPDFHRQRLTFRQRACFWSGFLYYISTAVNAFTSLLPPLFLLWLDPHGIALHNYFWLLPVLCMYPVTLAVHDGCWRPGVLRVKIAYSFTHALALWHIYRGELAEWVVTGAAPRRDRLPVAVCRLMCGWLVSVQLLLWSGVGVDLADHRVQLETLVPLLLMSTFNALVVLPLVGRALTVHRSPRPPVPPVTTAPAERFGQRPARPRALVAPFRARLGTPVRALLGALAALLVAGCALTGPTAAVRASPGHHPTTRSAAPAPPRDRPAPVRAAPYLRPGRGLYLGLSLPGAPPDLQAVRRVDRQIGRPANLLVYFQSWSVPVNTAWARAVWHAHLLPVLTWEPWSAAQGDTAFYQPRWTLRAILSGRYDAYLRASARRIARLGFPLGIRLAHEMNGYWYPWGVETAGAGNTPGEYVAMWRHVWRIFRAEGATNVIWIWSPNVVSGAPHLRLATLYPGARYVDWIGLSGYLSGPVSTFAGEYAATLAELRRIAPSKPWLVTETGASGGPDATQAAEILRLFHGVLADRHFVGITYFDYARSKRADWQFSATPGALRAVREAVAARRFDLPARVGWIAR